MVAGRARPPRRRPQLRRQPRRTGGHEHDPLEAREARQGARRRLPHAHRVVTLDTNRFRVQIEGVFREFGVPDCDLQIVPSVQVWARDSKIPEPSPFRVGMAVIWKDGTRMIALNELITPNDRKGIIGGMELRGLADETERLREATDFLEHLVLHEVVELLMPYESETAKDRWAFEHLAGRFRFTS